MDKVNEISLTPGKSFSFPLTYPLNSRYTRIIDSKNGEVIFCTYNSKTFKRIDLFTLDGKIIKTVPLKDILILERSISDIVPISADSFLILADYSNSLYLINAGGKILKQALINTSPVDSLRMEMRGSMLSGCRISKDALLFACTYYYKDENKPFSLSAYFKMNKMQPYFLSIQSPFDSAPEMTFGLSGFYNRIFKDDDGMCAEPAMYVPTSKGILLTSWYTDSLFLIDNQDFSIKHAVKMVSKYSNIGCTPLTTKEFQNDKQRLNSLLSNTSCVLSINYDSFRDLIYIVIRAEAQKDKEGPSLDKSLLVYDGAFNLRDEIRLDYNKYDLSEMYVLKEGLLINKLDKNHGNDSKFQLFYVDEK